MTSAIEEEFYSADISALFDTSLRLRMEVRRQAPNPAAYDRLALLKAQCLDSDSVYNSVVADRGYDPLDRMALRLDREGQKR